MTHPTGTTFAHWQRMMRPLRMRRRVASKFPFVFIFDLCGCLRLLGPPSRSRKQSRRLMMRVQRSMAAGAAVGAAAGEVAGAAGVARAAGITPR